MLSQMLYSIPASSNAALIVPLAGEVPPGDGILLVKRRHGHLLFHLDVVGWLLRVCFLKLKNLAKKHANWTAISPCLLI